MGMLLEVCSYNCFRALALVSWGEGRVFFSHFIFTHFIRKKIKYIHICIFIAGWDRNALSQPPSKGGMKLEKKVISINQIVRFIHWGAHLAGQNLKIFDLAHLSTFFSNTDDISRFSLIRFCILVCNCPFFHNKNVQFLSGIGNFLILLARGRMSENSGMNHLLPLSIHGW